MTKGPRFSSAAWQSLDPVVRGRLEGLPTWSGGCGPEAVERARAEQRRSAEVVGLPVPPGVDLNDWTVVSAGRGIGVREYTPQGKRLPGAIVFMHGGGWVVGDLDTYDELCARLALASGARVFSVDYRLAPEHPYPAALDDGEAVIRGIIRHAAELEVDPGAIVVAGDSAGGNLATSVALRLEESNQAVPVPAGQILIYPVLDAAMTTSSYETFGTGFGLSRAIMEWYWNLYCPDRNLRETAEVSPGRGLPGSGRSPLAVVVASHDPLRDEILDFVRVAKANSRPVEVLTADGHVHGFIRWTGLVDESQRVIAALGRMARPWLEARASPTTLDPGPQPTDSSRLGPIVRRYGDSRMIIRNDDQRAVYHGPTIADLADGPSSREEEGLPWLPREGENP